MKIKDSLLKLLQGNRVSSEMVARQVLVLLGQIMAVWSWHSDSLRPQFPHFIKSQECPPRRLTCRPWWENGSQNDTANSTMLNKYNQLCLNLPGPDCVYFIWISDFYLPSDPLTCCSTPLTRTTFHLHSLNSRGLLEQEEQWNLDRGSFSLPRNVQYCESTHSSEHPAPHFLPNVHMSF